MIWEKMRDHIQQLEGFRRCLRRGRLSHAYLFVGPEGIGKKLFARNLAQCLLCQRFDEVELEACGECSSCRQMMAGSHPDFLAVGCPEGKSELPIEVFAGTRERRGREGLCYELSLRPMAGRRKIAVIDDADLMNAESANALLKTLEEPPGYSLLILIATTTNGLLPTIRSRCQEVRFDPLPQHDIARLLLEVNLVDDENDAEVLAAVSEGSLAVATQLLAEGLSALREALYNSLADDVADPLAVSRQMIAGLDEMGGDTLTQRRAAGWLVRFAVEFYRRALRELSECGDTAAESRLPGAPPTHRNGGHRRVPIPMGAGGPVVAFPAVTQVRRYVERHQPPSSDELELVIELAERAALAENHLERKTSVPLCLETLFDDLARISRRFHPTASRSRD